MTTTIWAQCKKEVIDNYNEIYIPSLLTSSEIAWTGDVDSCIVGEISDTAYAQTLTQINYFRDLVGLPPILGFKEDKNAKCQDMALMIMANNAVSHFPPSTWNCFTQSGYEAASLSNLVNGTPNMYIYIEDPGVNNASVGHRRHILSTKAGWFGVGLTQGCSALGVLGDYRPEPIEVDYIAYPDSGYFPAPLIYPRWSFSVKDADFENAEITIKKGSKKIDLDVIAKPISSSANAIVWEPDLSAYNLSIEDEVKFKVEISNVFVNGEKKKFKYTVVSVIPTPVTCDSGHYWRESDCKCVDPNNPNHWPNAVNELSKSHFEIFPNPSSGTFNIQSKETLMTQITIYTLNGELIMKQFLEPSMSFQFQIPEANQGIYIAEIRTNDGSIRHSKLIIK